MPTQRRDVQYHFPYHTSRCLLHRWAACFGVQPRVVGQERERAAVGQVESNDVSDVRTRINVPFEPLKLSLQ